MKTALIIEDEIPAAQRLSRMLLEKSIAVIGSVRSNAEATAWLRTNEHPDIIFADIELGDGRSFTSLRKTMPKSAIVFVTAYDQYALEAFAHGGIDYLLKPVTEQKLQGMLENLDHKRTVLSQPDDGSVYRSSFLVSSGHSLRKIPVKNIVCFVSEANISYLLTDGRQFPITRSLDALSAELDPYVFFRISRKAIVNPGFIDQITGVREVRLKGLADALLISKARFSSFLRWFQK